MGDLAVKKSWSDQNLSEFEIRGEPDWSDLTNLKRSDRFLIRSFMLQQWYHVDPRLTAVTVVPVLQHEAPD